MSQVFLSYRHVPPDEKLAKGLCAYLQERGLRVFIDEQIEVGLDWAAEIDRQLRASSSFVVLLSEDSIGSDSDCVLPFLRSMRIQPPHCRRT